VLAQENRQAASAAYRGVRRKNPAMPSDKVDRWIQLATAVAIVVGLALVIWELQQTRALTFAQVVHSNMDEISQERTGIYGEDLGEVLAIACYSPDELTRAQAFVLDAYFENQSLRVVRYWVEVETAGFSTDWQRLGARHLRKVLGFPQGRGWIEGPAFSSMPFPGITDFVEEALNDDPMSCRETINQLAPGRRLPDA